MYLYASFDNKKFIIYSNKEDKPFYDLVCEVRDEDQARGVMATIDFNNNAALYIGE